MQFKGSSAYGRECFFLLAPRESTERVRSLESDRFWLRPYPSIMICMQSKDLLIFPSLSFLIYKIQITMQLEIVYLKGLRRFSISGKDYYCYFATLKGAFIYRWSLW
jgi:hypothetical protein